MSQRAGKRRDLERFVDGRISQLQREALVQGSSRAKGLLARLRQSLSRMPGESPDTWEVEFSGLPESIAGKGSEEPTAAEWAVHLALALYATHQQSQQREMYKKTNVDKAEFHGVGHAVGRLVRIQRAEGRGEQLAAGEMPRRFKAMVTADSIEELAHYARQLVTQLRAAGIELDYARFAGQVFDYQNPYRRDRTKLEWAREFSQQQSVTNSEGNDDTPASKG